MTRLLETAAKNRAVAATECNERSSRSHCLFQLILSGTNSKTSETCRGKRTISPHFLCASGGPTLSLLDGTPPDLDVRIRWPMKSVYAQFLIYVCVHTH